jgi:hypothetical protein
VHIHFLYPSHPLEPEQPDEPFREQVNEMRRLGFGVSIVSLEELGEKVYRIRNPIPSGATVVYRGWMLAPAEYEQLVTVVESHSATPLISPEMYLACHHLPNWYPLISDFTAETRIFPISSDFVRELRLADGTYDDVATIYPDEKLHHPDRLEWRDGTGTLRLQVEYEYEVDGQGNWTTRRTWVWTPELTEKKLYKVDLRTLTYWGN